MAKAHGVSRPIKKAEYTIVFGTRQAEKGWTDLKAAQLNAVVDAWDFLTRTPRERLPKNLPLALVSAQCFTQALNQVANL